MSIPIVVVIIISELTTCVCAAVEQEVEKKCVKLLTVLSMLFLECVMCEFEFLSRICVSQVSHVSCASERTPQASLSALSSSSFPKPSRGLRLIVFLCLSTTLLYYIRRKRENSPQELTYKLYISVRKVRCGELY